MISRLKSSMITVKYCHPPLRPQVGDITCPDLERHIGREVFCPKRFGAMGSLWFESVVTLNFLAHFALIPITRIKRATRCLLHWMFIFSKSLVILGLP